MVSFSSEEHGLLPRFRNDTLTSPWKLTIEMARDQNKERVKAFAGFLGSRFLLFLVPPFLVLFLATVVLTHLCCGC